MTERITVGRHVDQVRELLDALISPEDYAAAEALLSDELAALRDQHVRMYQRRLDGNRVGVDVNETARLLELWRGVADRPFTELTPEQQVEVLDALVSER
jgi:hypothetical protein